MLICNDFSLKREIVGEITLINVVGKNVNKKN